MTIFVLSSCTEYEFIVTGATFKVQFSQQISLGHVYATCCFLYGNNTHGMKDGTILEAQWRSDMCVKGFRLFREGIVMFLGFRMCVGGCVCEWSWLYPVMRGIGCWPQVPCRCAGAAWLECGPTLRDSHQPEHSTCRDMDKGQLCMKPRWDGLRWSPCLPWQTVDYWLVLGKK